MHLAISIKFQISQPSDDDSIAAGQQPIGADEAPAGVSLEWPHVWAQAKCPAANGLGIARFWHHFSAHVVSFALAPACVSLSLPRPPRSSALLSGEGQATSRPLQLFLVDVLAHPLGLVHCLRLLTPPGWWQSRAEGDPYKNLGVVSWPCLFPHLPWDCSISYRPSAVYRTLLYPIDVCLYALHNFCSPVTWRHRCPSSPSPSR